MDEGHRAYRSVFELTRGALAHFARIQLALVSAARFVPLSSLCGCSPPTFPPDPPSLHSRWQQSYGLHLLAHKDTASRIGNLLEHFSLRAYVYEGLGYS